MRCEYLWVPDMEATSSHRFFGVFDLAREGAIAQSLLGPSPITQHFPAVVVGLFSWSLKMDTNKSELIDAPRCAVTDEQIEAEVERRWRSAAELLTFTAGAKWAIERLLDAAKSHEGGGGIEAIRADNVELRSIRAGRYLFEFSSLTDWVNRANKTWKRHEVRSEDTICIDSKGRICTFGKHFMTAQKENAYPIRVYMIRDTEEAEGGAP